MLVVNILIITILIITIFFIIYCVYKNDNDEIDYDKWCKMLNNETKNNIDIIKENEKEIKKLNKQIKSLNDEK